MQHKQIVLGNQLISYYEESEGEQTIIFLHGWRSESAVWFSIFKLLRSLNFKLYALDLPGFGKSETPKHPFTLQDYAAIVQEFLLKIDGQASKVTLVGHSFGARIAAKLAAEHPEFIQKLVLIDSGGIRPHAAKRAILGALTKIIKPIFRFKLLKPLYLKLYRWIGAEDYVATPELKQTLVKIINEDLAPLFPKITAPTLIVWGENDEETPVSYARMMHETIPNSQLAIIKNAGHFSFLDQPEEFAQTLNNFLRGNL